VTRDPAVLNMLIKVCGIDIEARNEYQSTCCYTAVTNSNVVALRCFVEAGADVNCVRVDVMPLHMVNDIECAMILLAAGAEMNSGFLKLSEACVVVPQFLHALLAAGANLDMKDCDGCTLREHLEDYFDIADDDVDWSDVEVARRDIAKLRLDFVRQRALQVCIGLQPLGLDALQTCEILVNACGTVAPFVEFHKWWKIATTVKHFIQLKIEN
jgi:hypothetical protein